MRRFFLDSRSERRLLRSDLVTRLRTPASSTTYDSTGGPSLSTSNSEARAESRAGTGQKLMARERAKAASPCWTCGIQPPRETNGTDTADLFGSDTAAHLVSGLASALGWRLLRCGFGWSRDLGWKMGEKEEEETMVSMAGRR